MNRRHCIRSILAALVAPGAAGGARADGNPLLTAEEQAWVERHPVVLYAPERDFPPFSFVDGQGRHRGLSADILELVQQHTGQKFQAVAPGERALNLDRLRRHEIDLVTSLNATPAREAYMSFTSAYVSSPGVVLRRRADRRPGDLARMDGQRVAVERRSAISEYVREAAPELEVVDVSTVADGLRAVAFEEVDAAVMNLASASYLIARDHVAGLRVAGQLSYFATLSLGFRKDWPMLGRVLEKGLGEISEAERAAVMARWIPLTGLAWWRRPEVQRVLGVAAIGTGLLMSGLLLWNRTLRRAVAQRTEALRGELAERQRLEQQLRQLAEHDPLTGLMNRSALAEALRRSLALAARHRWSVAVVFIDLDDFKAVNDTYGHAAGDELLRQIAARLRASLRESDLLGRLGGDEFIVVGDAMSDGPRNAIELADKLTVQMKRPYLVDNHPLQAGFSAGIAIYPGDGDSPEALIAHADAAMYEAKQNGGGKAVLYRAAPAPTTTSSAAAAAAPAPSREDAA